MWGDLNWAEAWKALKKWWQPCRRLGTCLWNKQDVRCNGKKRAGLKYYRIILCVHMCCVDKHFLYRWNACLLTPDREPTKDQIPPTFNFLNHEFYSTDFQEQKWLKNRFITKVHSRMGEMVHEAGNLEHIVQPEGGSPFEEGPLKVLWLV